MHVLEHKVRASEFLEPAFANLKDELCDGGAVRSLKPDIPFVIEADAPIPGVGTVLLQSEGEEDNLTLF